MTCHNCQATMVKAGFYGRDRVQRFKCQSCRRRLSAPKEKPLGDRRLPKDKMLLILNCLVEGNSIRSTARLCGVEKRTVMEILKAAGEHCERLLADRIRNVPVSDLELDEVWTYVQKKQRRLRPDELALPIGDAYTFIALERTSKLVVAWHLGKRTLKNTEGFVTKIRTATAPGRFEVSTDGFQAYDSAIDYILSDRANHSQVVKVFRQQEEGRARYSPAKLDCVQKYSVSGMPNLDSASTSHVERRTVPCASGANG